MQQDMTKEKQERQEFLRLKEVLLECRKSQKWLAAELDVHPTTISKWGNHKEYPSIKTLYLIADVLEINVKEILLD